MNAKIDSLPSPKVRHAKTANHHPARSASSKPFVLRLRRLAGQTRAQGLGLTFALALITAGLAPFCALLLAPTPAAAASRFVPGSATILLQPPEAVAAGARWSIDGSPLQPAGTTMPGLAPGSHVVQFAHLPGWIEPAPMEVLVIGGSATRFTAAYRPVPRHYFRSVPEQRVRSGATLELIFQTDDPADPLNPGPGVPLQLTVVPPPAGTLQFDPAAGRLTYTPSPADRLPFQATLATAQGVTGRFEITPLPPLAPDASILAYDRPLPDAESRDYLQISEIPNGPELFNDAIGETYTASVSGPTLVFGSDHPAHLLRQFHGRLNLRELRLYADIIVIRSPLVLPQTTVRIHARELRFEGDGRIDTTPRARARRPDGAVWEDDLVAGRRGDDGHPGGDVHVAVERFYSDDTSQTRFVLRGGDGGPAGEGRHGRSESTVAFLSADWFKLMARAGNPFCGTTENSSVMLAFEDRLNGVLQDVCGSRVTAFGEPAVPSGTPGPGGRGGTLHSTIDLSAHLASAGGAGGARGGNYTGGTLTARAFLYRISNTRIDRFGNETLSVSDTFAAKSPGANASAPFATPGTPGTTVALTNAGAWLHPYAVRSLLHYARDAYLNGRIAETRRLLGEYQTLLRVHERPLAIDAPVTEGEFAESVNLDQLGAEIDTLVHRIDSNLDYFGNPAGWVPMLSFEANFLAFQGEIEQSIPILYLSYWLHHAATNVQSSLAAVEQARDGLETERARLEAGFNQAQAVVPRLKTEAETIAFRIATVQARITNTLEQLERRARENVAEHHKLPFWRKAAGVLSVMADLVPVAQPTVGRIGEGLELLARVDPDKPIQSAKALAPQAFSVMTNKNIRVCLGSNAPPITATNAPGLTNAPAGTNAVVLTNDVRKLRLKEMSACARFLGAELKELSAVFKVAQVDDQELAAELEKLKAADTNLVALALELESLNADKARFAQELAAALQLIGGFSGDLAGNLVATHELEDRIALNLAALDHGALLHIQEMESRARDRLVQYQYLLAKSFQYRLLRPYNGQLQVTRLLARFQQLVETSSSHLLTQDEFENLKGIFIGELREIVAQSLDNVNAPARSLPKSYRLNAEQRRQLNEHGHVVLQLRELGLINAGDENVRLADLRTRVLSARPLGPVGSLALVRVNYEHLGVSRLATAGRTFLFRHYQTQSANPIVWNAIFDANTGQTANSTPTAAQQSLISVLLAQQPVPATNLVFFSQPAADAGILLTRDVSSDNGTPFVIDDLLFELQYDFTPTSSTLRELNVRVSDGLEPVITLSQPDVNGRQDGQGDFSRSLPAFALVTLQAPFTYGRYVFDRWIINNQPQTTPIPAVAVFLSTHTQIEARYRIPTPLALTPSVAPDGEAVLRFPSETGANYTLEQASRLVNPDWTPVASLPGNGGTLQFNRPRPTTPAFFRVRQDP